MSFLFRRWVFALVLLACWRMMPTAKATSCASPPDLRSNLLLIGGKLVFIQGTGSFTVLDAASGDVVLRKKSVPITSYSGKLIATEHGILLSEYSKTTRLSWPALEPIWSVNGAGDIRSNQDMFISHDGNETVSGYRVTDGKRLWSLKVPGGWGLVVRDDDPEPDLLYESVRPKLNIAVTAILLAVMVAVWNVRRLRRTSLRMLEQRVLPEEAVTQTRDAVSGMLSSYLLLAITGLVVFVGLSQFTSVALIAIALTSLMLIPFSGLIASLLSRPGKQTSTRQDFSESLS